MGYYFDGPPKGKVQQLINQGAQPIAKPKDLAALPSDKALIVVIDSGFFDAAGLAYSDAELVDLTQPGDTRPRTFLSMDKATAHKLTGYKQ